MTIYDPRLTSRPYRLLRLWVLDRDHHTCQIRGPRCTHAATCVDHITARTDGGAVYDPANLRASCVACNGWRAAVTTNARRYHTHPAVYETRM